MQSRFALFVLKTLQVLVLGIYTELAKSAHLKDGVLSHQQLVWLQNSTSLEQKYGVLEDDARFVLDR